MKLKGLSEKELIQALKQDFLSEHKSIILGIGDDAAVISPGSKYQILTKDLLIENTHFLAAQHPARLLARKSLSVNLSDVAAMGCRPRYVLFGLGLPPGTGPVWIEEFMSGLKRAVDEFDVSLVGGDVTQAERISISVTIIGEGERFFSRSGAHVGDRLYVSGTLGDAACGLALLKDQLKLGDNPHTDICLRAFLDPIPQIALGLALARLDIPSAMIDISDGLSVDLGHICEDSGIGAEVYEDTLPMSEALMSLSPDPLRMALHGGEDYQLLFAVSEEKATLIPTIQEKFCVKEIGCFIPGKDVYWINAAGLRELLVPAGFQHFRKGTS